MFTDFELLIITYLLFLCIINYFVFVFLLLGYQVGITNRVHIYKYSIYLKLRTLVRTISNMSYIKECIISYKCIHLY